MIKNLNEENQKINIIKIESNNKLINDIDILNNDSDLKIETIVKTLKMIKISLIMIN